MSAVALPLSLTFSVLEPEAATTFSVPASRVKLPVFVGALLETLTMSPAPAVIVVVLLPTVLCTLTVSATLVLVAIPMPPPNVPAVE